MKTPKQQFRMVGHYKLLGTLAIEKDDGQLSPVMKYKKGSALLAYLIVNGRNQSREVVADLLWDASSTNQSLRNLRATLFKIQPMIPELVVSRKQITFRSGEDVEIDYDVLQAALNSGDLSVLDSGLALYKGDLLGDFYLDDSNRFNEWLLLERERLRREVWDGYRRLLSAYTEQEDWKSGITTALRWLALDDVDEEILRHLMQLLAANGQVTAALQGFESGRQRLWDELGVEPEPATVELATRLEALQAEIGDGLSWEAIVEAQVEFPKPGELAEPGPLPPQAYLPYHRNVTFTGRVEELLHLSDLLLPPRERKPGLPRAAVITGMGGLGKTQLAVEYAYRYGRYYPGGVYWMSFANPDNIPDDVATIGGQRGMGLFKETDKLTRADQVASVRKAWQEPVPRLLIFDNCESEALAADWVPVSGGCSVLLTSRRGFWSPDLGITQLALKVLASSESVTFLQKLFSDLESEIGTAIAEQVGDLPLALHLAGSFLRRYHQVTPEHYLEQLRALGGLQHPSLKGQGIDRSPTAHDLSVAQTFVVSLAQMNPEDEIDQMAKQLLARAACFAPGNPIPISLLLSAVMGVPLTAADDFDRQMTAEFSLERLVAMGFITAGGNKTVVMHRLVAAFVNNGLDKDGLDREIENTAAQWDVEKAIVNKITSYKEKDPILIGLPFSAVHLRHATRSALAEEGPNNEGLNIEELQEKELRSARLALLWGSYLFTASEYDRARPYLERSLAIRQRLLNPNHPDVAESLGRMGRLFYRLGDYGKATLLFEQTLSLRESMPEQDPAEMASTLRDLGTLHMKLADYDRALVYHERELALRRQHFGPTHLLVAQSLSTLGNVYGNMGKYNQAKVYQEQSLEIYEQSASDEEAVIARLLNNLSTTCYRQGDYETARKYMEQCLQIRKKIYAEDHYFVGKGMGTLGYILINLGEFETARPYLEQAVAILEEKLGRKHMVTVRGMTHWGNWLFRTGDVEAARELLLEALKIQESIKSVHMQAADILNLLGEIAIQQGKLAEARPFLDKALDIWSELQKEPTLDKAHTSILMGEWHQAKQEMAEARILYEQALFTMEKSAVPTHNDFRRTRRNMAAIEAL